MSPFDRIIPFDAPSDAVRLAISLAIYPALVVVRPEQARAIARTDDFLHLFQWTSSGDQTSLRYWIRDDMPGALEQLADDPSVYDAACADLTDLETAAAESILNRLSTAVADIHPSTVTHPMPDFAPFGMRALFLWTLFLGPAGVLIAAMNWRRMGRPARFWPTAILGSAAYSLLALGWRAALLVWTEVPSLSYWGLLPFAAAAGALLVGWQRPTYRRFIDTHGVPTREAQQAGCGLAALLVIAAAAMMLIAGVALRLVAGGPLESVVHRQTTVSGVAVTYPAAWNLASQVRATQLNCPSSILIECVFILERLDGSGMVIVQRQRQTLSASSFVVINALTLAWLRMSLGEDDFEISSPTPLKVGGRPALLQRADIGSAKNHMDLFYVQESSSSYLVLMALSARDADAGREIDSIIDSLHFNSPESPPV